MSHFHHGGDKRFNLQTRESVKSNNIGSTNIGSTRNLRLRRMVMFCAAVGLIALLCAVIFLGALQRPSFSVPSIPLGDSYAPSAEQADASAQQSVPMIALGALPNPSSDLTVSTALATPQPRGLPALATPVDLAQAFAEAEVAFNRGAWTEAIALYTEIREADESYQAGVVNEHLALAYRNAAMEIVEAETHDDGTLEMARRYFREAIALNPNDVTTAEEYALLTNYMAGVRALALQEVGEALELLLEVYEMRPDYMQGAAAQQLYNAYVAQGDIAFRRGESDVARELYSRAVALGLSDMDAAQVRLASIEELVMLTPTAYPANLATVQAGAVARGLPPVLLPTPTPASGAEATARAEYATAVALTTGTFTPEPELYVTPILVVPSPPAESMATEVARAVEATARASAILVPTNTPMPYNAVIGEYLYATPRPGNVATAQAQAVIAEANLILHGTATPVPWHIIVITPVPPTPTPFPTLLPTSTPVPLLIPVSELTATPTTRPTMTPPATFPPEMRDKIVFLSDRGGATQVYLLDPKSGAVSLVTQDWVYTMAREQLTLSPDGSREAVVLADSNHVLQVQIHDHQFDTNQELTAVRTTQNPNAMAYDPAWSPTDETIAYVSSEFAGDEIYTISLADKIPHRLTNNTWEWDKHPTWSPDGSQIVFFSNRESGRSQLWIMNADGSDQHNLSNNEYNDWNPIWIR